MDEAKRLDAIPYDVKNVELGHHGKECSFEAIIKKYKLTDNRALVLLGKIVNGADTDDMLNQQAEGPGLEAIAERFYLASTRNECPLCAKSEPSAAQQRELLDLWATMLSTSIVGPSSLAVRTKRHLARLANTTLAL